MCPKQNFIFLLKEKDYNSTRFYKFQAYLWGGSAWVAENSDFQQALMIDLGSIKNVTGIATQVNLFFNDETIILGVCKQ